MENGVYDSVMYHIVVCYMFGFDSSYSMFFHCILMMCYHMVAFYVEHTWCCSFFLPCVLLYFGVLYFAFALLINRNMVHNVLFDYIFYGHIISYYFP